MATPPTASASHVAIVTGVNHGIAAAMAPARRSGAAAVAAVAQVISWLCSHEARMVTGNVIRMR